MKIVSGEIYDALVTCKRAFLAVAFFSLFINVLLLVPSFYMLEVYDRVVSSRSTTTLLMLTLIMTVLMCTYGALEWIRSRIMIRVSTRLDLMLGDRVFNAGFKQALYTNGIGASSQTMGDLTGLRQFLTGSGLFAFFDIPWIPIYMGIMFFFHPWFGYLTVFGAVIAVLLAVANEKLTGKKLLDANRENGAALSLAGISLRNAEAISSMGMLPNLLRRWKVRSYKVLDLQGRASESGGAISSISRTWRILLQSFVLGIGAYLVIHNEVTPGLMTAASLLMGRALAPIDQMIGNWRGFVAARGQYARLNQVLDQIPSDPERMELPTPKGDLSVEQIVVTPPGGHVPVIKGISFRAPPGASVGILGSSAAGKSTLARALLGIWPAQSGKVRLDGADMFHLDRAAVGPHLGYLPQDIELFDGTIAENIARFGKVDATKVFEAAQAAGVHDMILRLPQGYDTLIGAHGGVLSGGQRQRVGLARALYGDPKLVVLDEPNSNLDDVGERALGEALIKLKQKGTTLFIITHRVSALAYVDNLMVLSEGQIVMSGARDQVLAQLKAQQTGGPQAVPSPVTSLPPKPGSAGVTPV
ncbi:type I secretion system permease/ATPase [Pseudomonas oryzihabitans]|jgi:ATP-binding cassette subfamily C protein EexD|uniref:type I secretion system permease/ATPase n=1 Tax=Pseudomonas oryzihabitans TaxID=47885 RepID=UPI002556A7D9|nr:type I secretion system permease/ATPase [Pseudomonas oryzihabitans]MDK8262870.1 type I secretion system permease/ATPase [Pseudomonas oryzihabitans]